MRTLVVLFAGRLFLGDDRVEIRRDLERVQSRGKALQVIRQSAREASERVDGIARSTDDQSRASKLVANAAQETSSQVQQIATAMGEQAAVSEQMLKSSEAALELCRHVHRSTEEQRETGRYITGSMSAITEMIRQIKDNATRHAHASDSVSEAVMRMLENAQESGKQVPAIRAMLGRLSSGAEVILSELSRFEGAAGEPGAADSTD